MLYKIKFTYAFELDIRCSKIIKNRLFEYVLRSDILRR